MGIINRSGMYRLIIVFSFFIQYSSSGFAQWVQDSLPSSRVYFQAVTFEDKVYFIGGQTSNLSPLELTAEVSVFDCITSTWLASTAISSPRDHSSCASGDSAIYVFGGRSAIGNTVDYGTNVVDIYKNGVWHTDTIADNLWGGRGLKVGSKVMFAGFVDSINNVTKEVFASNKVYIFDEVTGAWSTDTLSSARWQLAAATNDTIALFGGGVNGLGMASNVVDIYNSVTNTWTRSSLSVSRGFLGACYGNGKFYFGGGVQGGALSIPSDVVDVYDGSGWTNFQLSEPRAGLQAASVNHNVYFMGGDHMDLSLLDYNFNNSNTTSPIPSSIVEVLNASTGTWSRADFNNHIVDFAYTTWGNKIFVGGGRGIVRIWQFGTYITWLGFPSPYIQILDFTTNISAMSDGISFDVYPNPSTGMFTVLLPASGAEVSIRDILGREILKTETSNRKIDIHLDTDHNNGMYLVFVRTKQGVSMKKLLLNR